MKKTRKNDPAKAQAITTANVPVLAVPRVLYYGIMAVWGWFVLTHYFGVFPLRPLGAYFSHGAVFQIAPFLPRLLEHIINIFCALSVFAAAYGFGSPVLKRFYPSGNGQGGFAPEYGMPVYFIFSSLVGLGIVAIGTLVLGLFGVLFKTVFIPLIALGVVSALYDVRKYSWKGFPDYSLIEKLGLFTFLLIAFINATAALAPETYFDSQFYQLGVINQWLNEHTIHTTRFISASYFPMNVNMLYLAGMLLHDVITAKMINYFAGIFIAFSVYVFAEKHLSRTTAVFSMLIFYSIPNVILVSSKTGIELGMGMFEFGALFALVNYFNGRRLFWIVLAGVLCGLSMGSKYTSIAFCFIPMFIVVALWWKGWQWDQYRKAAVRVLLFVLCAAAVSMPWYVRNGIKTGNPVYPFFWQTVGFEKTKMIDDLRSDPPRPKATLSNYLLFLWPMTMGTLQQETYPGVLFLLFVPLLFLMRKPDEKIKVILVYVVVSIIFWIVVGRFYLRYFIPSMAAVSVLFAYYIVKQPVSAFFRNVSLTAIIAAAFVNAAFSAGIMRVTQNPLPYVIGAESKKEYLSTQRPSYPCTYYQVLDYANSNLDAGDKILFIGESRGLYCERKFIACGYSDFTPVVEWTKESRNAGELYRKFQENHVTHILVNLPEARRLNGYDLFYWNGRELGVFADFWKTYVQHVHRDIGDLSLPDRGISSMKREQPEWWRMYASDPGNYVYLFKLLRPEEAGRPHDAPIPFFLDPKIYTPRQWALLETDIEALQKKFR